MPLQTIGFPIDLSKGSHLNTEYKEERIQLKELGLTNTGKTIYATHGEWVSDVVDIQDEYNSLENLAMSTVVATNGSTYNAYTRTSKNGVLWEEYRLVEESTGAMTSTKNKFVQIKLEFIGKKEKVDFIAETFSKNTSKNSYIDNGYIDIDEGLKLKRNYDYKMVEDSSWKDEGFLLRKKIKKSDLKKIDSLAIR